MLNASSASSDFFGNAQLSYNQWTQTFIATAGDSAGGVSLSEFDATGYIWELSQVIAPPAVSFSGPSRLIGLLIKRAVAAAVGNFNPTNAASPYGAGVFASRNLATLNSVVYQSINAGAPPSSINPGPTTPPPPLNTQDLAIKISQIYAWALGAAALLALLMIILGGYLVMTAQGNAQQATKGKEFIYSAIIGLVLLFSSYLLLRTINPDLVNFPSTIQTQAP